MPDFHKDQFIQNCLMDYYIANEEGLLPEKAKLYFEANYEKLNKDQRVVFDYMKELIEKKKNDDGKLIFLNAQGGTGKHLHWMCW